MGKDAIGTDYTTPTHWSRLLQSIPASYTVWYNSSDSKYYAECNLKGGTDPTPNTDASTVLQTVNDALTLGGKIHLGDGTFSINTALALNSNIWLSGNGMRTILQAANNINVTTTTAKTNVILSNFQIDMNSKVGHGVVLSQNSTECWIDRVYVKNSAEYGVYVYESQRNCISQCLCEGGKIGVAVESVTGARPADYNKLINNICLSQTGGSSQASIHFEGIANYNLVQGNTCYDNQGTTGSGILFISNSTQSAYGNIIKSNHCYSNSKNGIRLQHQRHATVIGNVCYNNDDSGIALYADAGWNDGYNIIIGNQCYDTQGSPTQDYGIECESNACQYSLVKSNILRGNVTAGITGFSSTYGDIVRNNIGYATENSGTSTGTGAEQTIAHGLASTPNRIYLTPSASGITVINENKAADATNIYPIVTSGKAYYWKAEIV